MSISTTYVRARIDPMTKERAADALHAMGLSVSDAIRLLMLRIAEEHKLPFEIKVPDSKTKKAITQLEQGMGKRVSNISTLMASLHEKD